MSWLLLVDAVTTPSGGQAALFPIDRHSKNEMHFFFTNNIHIASILCYMIVDLKKKNSHYLPPYFFSVEISGKKGQKQLINSSNIIVLLCSNQCYFNIIEVSLKF